MNRYRGLPAALGGALLPLLLAAAAAAVAAAVAGAQEERAPGWYDSAELSFVSTTGNAEASTFGFKNLLERQWQDALLLFSIAGLRAEADSNVRFARIVGGEIRVVDLGDSELTAENYAARLRYERNWSPRSFWFGALGWERNEFAGFDSRTTAVGGVGTTWWQGDRGHFKTDYGVTYTQQDDLAPTPGRDDAFAGLRLGIDFLRPIGPQTTWTSLAVVDENLDETKDWRGDWTNSLAVAMNDRLALKASLQLLFDNQPAFALVPLLDEDDAIVGTFLAELDDLDSVLTVALVVNIK